MLLKVHKNERVLPLLILQLFSFQIGHKSLCKGKPDGSIFRLSSQKPKYFVTCDNGSPVCRRCAAGTVFSNDLKTCVAVDAQRPAKTSTTQAAPTSTTTQAAPSIDCKRPLYLLGEKSVFTIAVN